MPLEGRRAVSRCSPFTCILKHNCGWSRFGSSDAMSRIARQERATTVTVYWGRFEISYFRFNNAHPESASKKEPSYGVFLLEVMNAEADARRYVA